MTWNEPSNSYNNYNDQLLGSPVHPQPLSPDSSPPTSADACMSIVQSLMCHRQGETEVFSRRAIESLVRKMKEKSDELDALITSVTSSGAIPSKCVTIQRTLDGRLQVAGKKGFPHVIYARIWRWPDLNKNELTHIKSCVHAFDQKTDLVCVNPYHYERIVAPGIDISSLSLSTPCVQPQCNINHMSDSSPPGPLSVCPYDTTVHGPASAPPPPPPPQSHSIISHDNNSGAPQYMPVVTPAVTAPPPPPPTSLSIASLSVHPIASRYDPTVLTSSPQPPPSAHPSLEPGLTNGRHSEQGIPAQMIKPNGYNIMNMPPPLPPPQQQHPQQHQILHQQQQHHQHQHHEQAQPQQPTLPAPPSIPPPPPTPQQQQPQPSQTQAQPQQRQQHPPPQQHQPQPPQGDYKPNIPRDYLGQPLPGPNPYNLAPQQTTSQTSQPQPQTLPLSQQPVPPGPPLQPGLPPGPTIPRGQIIMSPPIPRKCSSQPPPEFWCSIAYFEMDQQVGETFKVSSSYPVVNVDGYTDPSAGDRFCLGALSNVHRTPAVEKARLHIGQGVRLELFNEGDVWLQNRSDNAVFLSSPYLDREHGRSTVAAVHKVYSKTRLKVFDLHCTYEQMIAKAEAAREAAAAQAAAVTGSVMPGPSNTSQVMNRSAMSAAAAIGVDDLRRLCILGMSFVKGWGHDYRRTTMKQCPCWIEVHLHRALQVLDEVLQLKL